MSVFNLTYAINHMHTKYYASWVEPNDSHTGFEAEVGLCLGDRVLLIEIFAEAEERLVRATEILTAKLPNGPVDSPQPLHFQNETTRYLANPQLIEYLEQIKRDIGFS